MSRRRRTNRSKVELTARCLFLALVAVPHHATAQTLSLLPAFGAGSGTPGPFLAGCLNTGSWSTVTGYTTYLGVGVYSLDGASDGDLQTCFSNMTNAGIQLVLEVPVLKGWCTTGAACFWDAYSRYARAVNLGAPLGVFQLDDPWAAGHFDLQLARWTAAVEVANWISLARTHFPGARIVEMETYPSFSSSEIQGWLNELSNACSYVGVAKPEVFQVDHDWRATGLSPTFGPFGDLTNIANTAHGLGMDFGVIFTDPQANTDDGFYGGTRLQAAAFADWGPPLDLYTVESYRAVPSVTVPEGQAYTFMNTVWSMISDGLIPVIPQPPPGGDYTVMTGGQSLYPEQSISSPNGQFRLKYQSDGNLVLYDAGGAPHWAINCWPVCSSITAGFTTMQTDGNFVVYDGGGAPVFHTFTYGNPGASLRLYNNGALGVYSSSGGLLWQR